VTFLNCSWHVAWVSCITKLPDWTAFAAPYNALEMFLCPVARSSPAETLSDPPNTWTYLHLKLQARPHSPVVCLYSGSQWGSPALGRLFPRPCLRVIQDRLPDFLISIATGPHSSSCVILLRRWFPIKIDNQAPQLQQSLTWRLIVDAAATSYLSLPPPNSDSERLKLGSSGFKTHRSWTNFQFFHRDYLGQHIC